MIRLATGYDIPEIMSLCYEMHESTDFKTTNFNPCKLATHVAAFIDSEDYCAFVAIDDECVVGMIFGQVQLHWWGNDLQSCDILLYVEKDYRKHGFAIELVNAYKQWALDKGVKRDQLRIGCTTGHDSKEINKLFTCAGFRKAGAIYSLRGD